MPSLANLRSRKNKPVNFTPSKAYWISGHGGEPNDGSTFTVPPGCIIVVKVSPGEISYGYERIAVNLDVDKLKDPIRNSNYLIDNFGPIAIFKPGDQCPYFFYELLYCFPYAPKPGKDRYNECRTFGSGVIDFDKITEKKSSDEPVPEGDLIEYMTNLYNNSVYPTKKQVKDAFGSATMDNIPKDLKTPAKKLDYLYEEFLDLTLCKVSQNFLCQNLKKGVFYNFVCRYRGRETYNVYNTIYNRNNQKTISAARGVEETWKTRDIHALLREKIGEAETRRKELIRNYANSPEYAARIAKQREIKKNVRLVVPDPLVLGQLQVLIGSENDSVIREVLKHIDYYKGIYTVDQIINYVNEEGETPLSAAVRLRKYELIIPLIVLGAKTDITVDGKTLIDIADNDSRMIYELNLFTNKTYDELQAFYRKYLKFGYPFTHIGALLTQIKYWSNYKNIEEVYLKNIDWYRDNFSIDDIVNYQDSSGSTPLFEAIRQNLTYLILPLLALGAKTDDPLLIPTNQETKDELLKYIDKAPQELKALWYARERGKPARNLPQSVNWLNQRDKKKTISINLKDQYPHILRVKIYEKKYKDALDIIKQIMAINFTSSLTRLGPLKYIKSQDQVINFDGLEGTPLWLAVKQNAISLIIPLLRAGAYAYDVNGKTLLDIASTDAKDILTRYAGKTEDKTEAEMDILEKEEMINKLVSHLTIPEEEKEAFKIILRRFSLEELRYKLQKFLDEKEDIINQLISYLTIPEEEKDALKETLRVVSLEELLFKLQKFKDKNAATKKKRGILHFFGLGQTRRRIRKN